MQAEKSTRTTYTPTYSATFGEDSDKYRMPYEALKDEFIAPMWSKKTAQKSIK